MSAKVFHIPLILTTPQMTLHSIVQRSPTSSNNAGTDHPSTKIYNSTDAMIADKDLDLIVVTTTPDSHFALTKQILESGKHAIVEKPFVPTVAEASSLIDIAKKAGKLICVYQNRRWDSDFLTFRKLQQDGTIGRITEYHTHFDRLKLVPAETWKGTLSMEHAGGVVYDLGTHLLDQAVVAFGLPKTVTALWQNDRADGASEPDGFTVMLGYGPGGPLITAKASIMSIEADPLRFWVRGTKGSWWKKWLDIQEPQLINGMKPGDKGFGIEEVEKAGTLTTLVDGKPVAQRLENVEPETYGKLYEGFVKAIESNDESLVPVKASEARDVLRVIEAVKESAASGKTVNFKA